MGGHYDGRGSVKLLSVWERDLRYPRVRRRHKLGTGESARATSEQGLSSPAELTSKGSTCCGSSNDASQVQYSYSFKRALRLERWQRLGRSSLESLEPEGTAEHRSGDLALRCCIPVEPCKDTSVQL